MKLRNKKTGEIFELDKLPKWLKETIQLTATFYSRECEVYEPKEPLIKDEKIRKAVRAWAECCCIPLVKHYLSNGLSCFICNDEEDNEYCLDFTFCINNLEAEHIYSITELCGEEK